MLFALSGSLGGRYCLPPLICAACILEGDEIGAEVSVTDRSTWLSAGLPIAVAGRSVICSSADMAFSRLHHAVRNDTPTAGFSSQDRSTRSGQGKSDPR
jgi:hypothetical protein